MMERPNNTPEHRIVLRYTYHRYDHYLILLEIAPLMNAIRIWSMLDREVKEHRQGSRVVGEP